MPDGLGFSRTLLDCSPVVTSVEFEPRSAALSEAARRRLEGNLGWLNWVARSARIEVVGLSEPDEAPTQKARERLARARADAVIAYLVTLGIRRTLLVAAKAELPPELTPPHRRVVWFQSRGGSPPTGTDETPSRSK
jgi:hypothetical protein